MQGDKRKPEGGAQPIASEPATETTSGFAKGIHRTQTLLEPGREEPIPQALGRYKVVARIGRGAMGTVYEATDGDSRSHIAIKAIRGLGPEAVYRFKREFRALAQIQHPNVVSLYELASDDEGMYFTMELVEGASFAEALCGPRLRDGPVHAPCRDYARLRDSLAQLVRGVQAIHQAGFLHRDLKPSNVLVAPSGRVVVLDFGLVRDLHVDDATGVTADGAVLGTPLYMSPEQATGAKTEAPSDWYSVGEMLYQVLTGRAPYAGLGMLALLAAKRQDMPPPPSSLVPEVPADLDALCMDLLQRRPEDRPTVDHILARLGSGASPIDVGEDNASPLFLGREAPLAALEEALTGTTAGRPVVALVEGVSGIGKSALVQRFLTHARAHDAVILAGRCSERESIPYKALDSVIDALSAHLRGLGSIEVVRALLPRDVHALSRLFPVLLGVPAVAMTPMRMRREIEPAEARRRGVDALRELFGRLADRQRLIVAIDDLQWSDVDSLLLLDAVLRHPDAPALLLVVTFRSGADHLVKLERFIADLEQAEPPIALRRIALGPIPTAQATQLALHLLGRSDAHAKQLARAIAEESEGSPFFVAELVRAQRRLGESSPPSAETPRLEDVIHTRIAALPEASRQLLYVVAVGGGRLPLGLAMRVNTEETLDPSVLARLRSEHLVRVGGPHEEDSVEIYHDRIREAALRLLDPEALPKIHLEIARALASSGRADEVALSHHFRQAGEDSLACLHTLAAADQAAEALAFDRAAELYRTALELGALPADEHPLVLARLADALANTGRLFEAARTYLRAAAHPRAQTPFEWKRLAAEHLMASGHSVEGKRVLGEVLGELGIEIPRSLPRTIGSLLSNRLLLALRGHNATTRASDEVDPAELRRLDGLWTAFRGLLYTDGIISAHFHARYLRLALRIGEPVRLALGLGAESYLLMATKPDEKHQRADQLLASASRLADAAGSLYARGMVLLFRGQAAFFIGEFERSLRELEAAVQIFRETRGTSQDIAQSQAHAALALQFLGRIRQLTPSAHALLREATELANPYVQGFARGALSNLVLLSADRVDEARHQLEIYEREAPRQFEAHQLNYACCKAAFDRYTGRSIEGWEFTERHYPRVRKLALARFPFARSELLLWRGSAALAAAATANDPAPYLQVATEMAQELLTFRIRYMRGYGHLLQASLKSLRGEHDVAARHLREAAAAFETHGMTSYLAVCRARLANLLGGREGEMLRAESARYFAREGVLSPERFTMMSAPGFVRE